jgi:uncharacterized protein (DUF1697 family)
MTTSSSKAKNSHRFVALLRGINVGGKNVLPMKDLVVMFEKAGCTDVVHYIQSGNVVFTAKPAIAKTIADVICKAIEKKFKIAVPVVVRSSAEIAAVASNNPFLKAGVEVERLHVVFLKDRPSVEMAKILDPNRSPGDSFEVRGGEIFLSITSAAKTKITNAWLDSKLKTVSTGRNWRTVLKLREMLHA